MMHFRLAILSLLLIGISESVSSHSFSFGAVLGAGSKATSPVSAFSFNSQRITATAGESLRRNSPARRVTARGNSRTATPVKNSSRGRSRQSPASVPIIPIERSPLNSRSRQPVSNIPIFGRMEIARTPTKVVDRESTKDNEIIIGRSPCAKGLQGQACRLQLQTTAMACTSGKCFECQQCGSISASEWVSCCRDHFLCCRPLAQSCLNCDQLSLKPFCKVAFGKCK